VDSQLARMGQAIILKTGMFPDGCQEWSLETAANQTWAAFKIHFARQDRDRIDTTTASSAGYGGAALTVVPVVVPSAPGTTPSAPTVPPTDPYRLVQSW
jgi:hypothetical protein